MTNETDIAAIKRALANHKEQIVNAHAETLALQSLLVGLMNALASRGVERAAIEEAFDYAAQVAMTGADKTGSTQPTLALQVIDQLRKAIISDNTPKHGV